MMLMQTQDPDEAAITTCADCVHTVKCTASFGDANKPACAEPPASGCATAVITPKPNSTHNQDHNGTQ
jgi:hypothetical protein